MKKLITLLLTLLLSLPITPIYADDGLLGVPQEPTYTDDIPDGPIADDETETLENSFNYEYLMEINNNMVTFNQTFKTIESMFVLVIVLLSVIFIVK